MDWFELRLKIGQTFLASIQNKMPAQALLDEIKANSGRMQTFTICHENTSLGTLLDANSKYEGVDGGWEAYWLREQHDIEAEPGELIWYSWCSEIVKKYPNPDVYPQVRKRIYRDVFHYNVLVDFEGKTYETNYFIGR